MTGAGLGRAIDGATGYFEIGGLLGLMAEWQKDDEIGTLLDKQWVGYGG